MELLSLSFYRNTSGSLDTMNEKEQTRKIFGALKLYSIKSVAICGLM